jgi:hypothetical protein
VKLRQKDGKDGKDLIKKKVSKYTSETYYPVISNDPVAYKEEKERTLGSVSNKKTLKTNYSKLTIQPNQNLSKPIVSSDPNRNLQQKRQR